MYKYSILAVFLLIFYTASAQIFDPINALSAYQSTENNLYWKNRKPFPGYWQQDVSYHIKAKLNDTTEIITGSEILEYANNSPDTIYKLYFRLTQNAFQPGSYKDEMEKGGKVFNKFGKYEKEKLGTKITKVVIAGNELQFVIDNTIMIIELPSPLYPGTTMKMEIDFKTYFDQGTMGRRMKRFEHNNFKHFDGVHWYPRLSVYDRKFKWTTDQHLGKEFYGDYGIYYVELDLPNHFICEATGVLTNKDEVYANGLREKIDISNFTIPSKTISQPVIPNGTYKRWIWMANNVHDFAFTADPTYRIGETEWNGIKCIALAQEQNAYAWQPTAKFVAAVVKTYSQDFGMYAYPKIVAADARDGMEYPMLTLDGGNWPGHQYVIAHEVGHNWFFGMVGNNETYRACLDEGFTQFLTAWSIKKLSNKDNVYPNPIDWAYVYAGYINHAINENTARLNIHSDHFNSAERHGGGYGQVYYKTATMLYNLQYVLGDELFLNAMKHYFNQWKFCHPYEEDFRQSIIDYTKVDLNWFFDDWFTTTKTIDYKIKKVIKVENTKYDYVVKIKRKGDMHMPLDVTVIDKKGNRLNYIIPNTYFTKKLGNAQVNHRWISWDMMNKTDMLWVQSQHGIKDVIIDTSGRLADINRLDNSLRLPYSFEREKLIIPPSNFNKLQNYWRPEVWYNERDGIKVGLNFSGNYYNFKHIYSATVWVSTNTGTAKNSPNPNLINFSLNYKTRVGKLLDFSIRGRTLDGINLFETGLEKIVRNDKFSISYKAFGTKQWFWNNIGTGYNPYSDLNSAYILYPKLMEYGINATLNLAYQHPFKYKLGNGLLNIGLRNTALFSDFNYSGLTVKVNNTNPIGKKLVLKSRVFTQYLHGSVPKESSLFAAGANNEDLIENKFTRSRGFVPNQMVGYGNTGQYSFQMGGGLNIRGMAGYLATNTKGQDTFYIYNGNKGAAINLELEFGKLIKLEPPKFLSNFRFNPYLFADAGILGNGKQYSGLRADAGLGTTFTIGFGKYNTLQPLVLRFDVPFFLNRVEPGANYMSFRYVVGINRAF